MGGSDGMKTTDQVYRFIEDRLELLDSVMIEIDMTEEHNNQLLKIAELTKILEFMDIEDENG